MSFAKAVGLYVGLKALTSTQPVSGSTSGAGNKPPPTISTPHKPSVPTPEGRLPGTYPMVGRMPAYTGLALYLKENTDAVSSVALGVNTGQAVLGDFPITFNAPNKASPGAVDEVEAAKKAGQLISIEHPTHFQGVARMIAGGAVVVKSATKPVLTGELRNWLKTARHTIKFGDAFKASFCRGLAQLLHDIGGIATTPHWVPKNHGVFAHGENKYVVPSTKSKDQLAKELLAFDAVDYAFEIAKAEAINAAMRVARGDTNGASRVIAGVAKLAGDIASQAAAGLQAGGPWGALVGAIKGAIESAFNQAFAGIAKAQDKTPNENAVLAELDRAFDGMAALVGGVRYPISEIGYGMNIPNPDPPRSIEVGSDFNQFFQRAAQNNTLGAIASFGIAPNWLAQGVYPGPALWAYKAYFGGVKYAWTTDGDDDMGPEAWERAPGMGSRKVSP